MTKTSPKLIYTKIIKTIGRGSHRLHEPLFSRSEVKFTRNTIKKNFVSSAGIYGEKFEKKIKKLTKAKYVVAVINGTQGLFISMQALGIKKNQEILVPSLTFVGTVNAINYTGAEPHFIDSNIKDFGIDCKKLEIYLNRISKIKNNKCINKKTGRIISGIVPVHIFGHSCDIENLIRIAKKYKLKIIEDAAEAVGSFYKNKHLGTYGDVGCLSFNGNKIITTGGGGMIITNNTELAKKAKHITTTAKKSHPWLFIHDQLGFNYRLPNLNAALGCAQMEQLEEFIKRKREIAANYLAWFSKTDYTFVKEPMNAKSNYWFNCFLAKNKKERDSILEYTNKNKIMTRPAWTPMHTLEMYKKSQKMDLKNTIWLEERLINIPSSVIQ